MPTVRINDLNMYYETRGEGEPLLLIPGLGSDISEYEQVIGPLSRTNQVVALDNRGAGRTDKPDVPYSIEMMADDAAGLLKAAAIGPAHVVGISMGGRVALALALQHPEHVKSLILVSTASKLPPRTRRSVRFLGGLWRRTPLERRTSKHPQPYYAFVRQLEASTGFDCTDRLDEIRVPTLILHGKRDRFAPYRFAEEMHAGIPGSSMRTFNGGHLIVFFQPRQCAEAITDFVRTV